MRMQVVGRLGSYISRGVSTVSGSVRSLGGAVDIVLVEQQDGSFKSSPWYVRFGKTHGVLRTEERMISINVNGEEASFHMYVDHKGQAFFLREVEAEEGESAFYPLSSGDETDILDKRHMKSRSFSFEDKSNYMAQGDMNTGNKLARTTSDGSVTSGLFIAETNARSMECAELAANLLEVKWSTNLAGHKPPRRDRVKFQKRKSQRDNAENSSNERRFYDEIGPLNAQDGLCSNPDIEVPRGLNEDKGTEHDRKMKEDITDRTVRDLEVACLQLEGSIEKKQLSGEDVSGVRIMPDYGISEEEIPPDGVQPLVYSGMSKSSIGCMLCTTEQTHEVLYLDNKIGEAHTHAEILQATIVLPEVTKNEEATKNADVMMPVMTVSQTSQQENCSHPGISKTIVAGIEDQTALPKTQTINLDIGLCSGEKDGSTCVAASSSDSSQGKQALEQRVLKVEEVSSTLTSPKSASDCVFGKTSRQPSSNPEEKDFIFSDLESQTDDQLLPEEPGFKDNSSLGDVKSTAVNPPLDVSSAHNPSTSGNWKLWPFSFRRSSSERVVVPAVDDKVTNASESSINKDADKNELKPKLTKKNVRAKTPTAEQLASLNLKEGRNTVTFSFSTDTLENEQVDAQIYLWKWDNRIVISDVDGTITKSDVLGQVMPLVGVDWSQTGVTHLFSAIKENGYKLLFLSARSISQAYQTRQFLINLKQDGKVLPDGPIVISPDGIFPSLYREVIRRAPHEFKISCLEDIKALFPPDSNPFYAGFGNRDTDEISYLKVGIPRGKIFIINPKGEIVVNRRHDTKTYNSLHALVNGMFPSATNTNTSEQEDFNSWNYWKLPPPLLHN